MKLLNTFPQLADAVLPIFDAHAESMDAEMQQRAVEYRAFCRPDQRQLASEVWEMMPAFPERESALTKKVKKHGFAPGDVNPDGGTHSLVLVLLRR